MSTSTQLAITTTDNFRRIAAASIARGYNRLPSDELLAGLDPDGTHVVSMAFPHEHIAGVLDPEGHVRTEWLMKLATQQEAVHVYLDMSNDDFNGLTRLRQNEDGEWVPLLTDEARRGLFDEINSTEITPIDIDKEDS